MRRASAFLGLAVPALVVVALACGDIRSADEPATTAEDAGDTETTDDGGRDPSGDASVTKQDGSTATDASGGDAGDDPCALSYPADAAAPDREWARWTLPATSPPTASYRIDPVVVCDRTTRLLWERNVTATRTWDDAVTYCDTLNLGGYTDWRLPTRIELISLVDYTVAKPAINTTAFADGVYDAGAPEPVFWSATPHRTQFLLKYAVDFSYGQTSTMDKSGKHAVRCVRGGL